MNNGKLMRKLRQERSISQASLAGNLYSRDNISRFERNNSNINLDMFFHSIDRMNLSLEEYAIFQQLEEPSLKEILKNDFKKALDTELGESYLQELYSEYEKSSDIYYLYLYSLGRILRHKIQNLPLDLSKDIQIIKQHLDKVESWGFFEFTMYANTFFLFEDNYIQQNYPLVIQKFNAFSHSAKFQHLKIRFLLNSLTLAFERKQFEIIDSYLTELFNSTENSDYILGRIFWKFFDGLNRTVQHGQPFDTETTYSWLRSLGYTQVAENLLEIEKFIQ
ncbi:helix-turn-helix domain-containing protein [Enterococcus aquimarinus]|uniref:HTH cro/C1-type domain-containing protein n=1 Tax=Enterococcus aquimarinus TaxID=328396 RepID=A0A1L8QWC8_9ENTE|nr:Rgg/GadR/MutR family transcriptional regulator [Enterococcus aquimarinus]OJG11815.1 hypothetical protein RU93_GL001048 [Enterococcus aquimarinus]